MNEHLAGLLKVVAVLAFLTVVLFFHANSFDDEVWVIVQVALGLVGYQGAAAMMKKGKNGET